MAVCVQCVCNGEEVVEGEYNNFSNTSWGIANDCRWLFTEQYTYITKYIPKVDLT